MSQGNGSPVGQVTVSWDRDMLRRFRTACRKAHKKKQETVIFEGNEYLLTYASYLIQYLDGVLQ